jgi:hypothetical protein
MPELFTRIKIPKPDFTIGYSSKVLLMGSCFTDNIGSRLKKLKFDVIFNPFGVVYNPISLSEQINSLINKDSFTKDDLNYFNELWFSYLHYTLFSDPDPDKCLDRINKSFLPGKEMIRSADVIILTLGTSFVFKLIESKKVVANCHKIPAKEFDRYFSSVENSVQHLKTALNCIREINPEVSFVFTVSPIRHWKDGAIENQRSKAALILAISQLQKILGNTCYFPVYEFFMDELRDYRYYASDMLHPSSLAIDLVWDKFSGTFFSSDTKLISKEIAQVISGLEHRPLHFNTKANKKFLSDLQIKIKHLTKNYSFLDFSEEIKSIQDCLTYKNNC